MEQQQYSPRSAITAHSFIWFLLCLLLIGAARGAVDQSRAASTSREGHRPSGDGADHVGNRAAYAPPSP